jgi:hypothetical protein
MAGPPNNRFKLPWFLLCAAAGIVFLAVGKYVAGGAILAGSLIAIATIVRGRNPWVDTGALGSTQPPRFKLRHHRGRR